MKAVRIVTTVFAIFTFVTGSVRAAQSSQAVLTRGEVKDGTYSNAYFGLRLSLPDGWVALSDDEIATMPSFGLAAKAIDQVRRGAPLASIPVLPLAVLVNVGGTSPGANIIVFAERLSSQAGPLAMLGYADNARREFQGRNPGQHITLETAQMNGTSLRTVEALLRHPDGVMTKRWYGVEAKGYAVSLLATFVTGPDRESVDSILKSMTLAPR